MRKLALDKGLLTGRQLWILLIVMTATFMAIMDSFIVNVAAPSVRADLDASYAQLEMAVGGYTLVYGLLLVTGGRLGDRYAAKPLFLTGVAIFALASLGAAFAAGPSMLIAFRVVQAVGAAMFYPQVLAVLQTLFSGRAQAKAFAVFGATIGLGSIAGQVVGGLLISLDVFGLGWRMIFLINAPLGVATLAGAARLLPSRPSHAVRQATPKLDLVGVALVALALLLLSVPLVEGQHLGWPSWIWVCLAASIPAVAVFLGWERRVAARSGDPLVPLELFRRRRFAIGNLIALAFFAGNAGLFFVLTLQLQAGMGYAPLEAGLTFAPLAIAFSAASLIGPRLQRRLGDHVLTVGYAVNAIGTLALLIAVWWSGADLGAWTLLAALAVIGFGQGLGVSPLFGTILGGVARRDAGAAGGVLETVGQLGMAFGVALLGLVFHSALGDRGMDAGATSYAGAFTLALIANLVLALLALALTPPLFHHRNHADH